MNSVDPYLFAGGVIIIVFAMGAYLVSSIYKMRTQTPSVKPEEILNNPNDETWTEAKKYQM